MTTSAKTASKATPKVAAKATAKAAPKATPKAVVKTVVKAAPKAAPKAASKPTSKAVTAAPSMRCYHSNALHSKLVSTLDALEQAPNPEKHRDHLADLVDELTASGMDYYFLRALQSAKVGFVVEQSAKLGLSGAVKLITSVSRKFIVRMDGEQLVVVARHIRALTA